MSALESIEKFINLDMYIDGLDESKITEEEETRLCDELLAAEKAAIAEILANYSKNQIFALMGESNIQTGCRATEDERRTMKAYCLYNKAFSKAAA